MITKLERLPNEILFMIFSNLSWSQLLTSFWSLNKRFDLLICSVLARVDRQSNGLLINQSDLSFNKISSLLFPFSSLTSSIRRIHFDETNSNISDSIDECLFDKEKNLFRFPNLQSFILTQCYSIKPFINILPLLVKHQLDELILTFDRDFYRLLRYSSRISKEDLHASNELF